MNGYLIPLIVSQVYFHCSVLICHRFHPDSPLCIPRCPRPSRSKRGNVWVDFRLHWSKIAHWTVGFNCAVFSVVESGMAAVNSAVVSLGGPVLLVPEEWSAAQGTEPVWCWGCYLGLVRIWLHKLPFPLLCREHCPEQGDVGWHCNDCCWCSLSGHNATIFGFS